MRTALLLFHLAFMSAVLGLGGCQSGPKVSPFDSVERMMAKDPAKPYLGMTRAEIVACAGDPASTYTHNTGETLVYRYSGAGPVPGQGNEKEKGKEKGKEKEEDGAPFGRRKSDKGWTCSASLVFEGGRLSRLNFAHKDVVSPYERKEDPKTGEKTYVTPPPPCTFSLPNCPRG